MAAEGQAPTTPWIEGFLLSIVSARFYVEVLRKWRGLGLVYLGLVLMLLGIPCAMKAHHDLGVAYREFSEKIAPQLAPVTFASGKATMREGVEQPLVVYQGGPGSTHAPVIAVDTTGATTSLLGRDEQILITGDSILFRMGNGPDQVMRTDVPNLPEPMPVDNFIREVSAFCAAAAGWIYYPFRLLAHFIMWLIHALLLAGLSSMMMIGRRLGASFGDLLRTSIVAATPVLFLDTIAFLIGVHWDLWTMVLAVVWVMYLTSGLRAAAEEIESENPANN